MISDFIEVNGLSARVISFPSDANFFYAAKQVHLSESACVKAIVFADEKMNFYAVISSIGEEIGVSDAIELFGASLSEPTEEDVANLTGFEKIFFPPIAVFGMKISFHSSADKKKTLFFRISPREYLIISKEELLESAKLSAELI